jgi:signal transduction histidine kinase
MADMPEASDSNCPTGPTHRAADAGPEPLRTALQGLETREANFRLFTRSLAHDFNNLISGILGHAELIRTLASDAEIRDSASVILQAAERARQLVAQLLDSSQVDATEMVRVDLHETIREVASLLRGVLPPSITIRLALNAERVETVGDPGQLHHMLLNLALNAREAMPGGGEISFETADVSTTPPGVRLTVRDTGCGIPPEIRARLFEPSFTTRPGGSGMGLAIVDRVVQQHGGSIEVQSEVGAGSAFIVTLPLRQPAALPASGGA